jgi:quercetin dioxygenase-like cupin family protein
MIEQAERRSRTAAAKDLRTQEPRSPSAELEGYAWLPRMLDTARATLAGTAGQYLFGCPVDHTCLARLGVSPDLLLELAGTHGDDQAVLEALRAHGIPSARDAWFDGQAVEDELQSEGTYLRVRARERLPERDGVRVFAGGEHGADVTVSLIEAEPGIRQEPHVHPTEEVVVVQGGQATFHLGQRQARIVRAGEIVRVPAGVSHWWVSSGAEPLTAVAVHSGRDLVSSPAGRRTREATQHKAEVGSGRFSCALDRFCDL